MTTFLISRTFTFDAAHWLPEYEGICKNLHGHRYELKVTYQAVREPKTGLALDFNKLKDLVQTSIINTFDHTCLNDRIKDPTAENILLDIFYRLVTAYDMPWLYSLTLKEGEKTEVTLLRSNVNNYGGVLDD